MIISDLKNILATAERVDFELENGTKVPEHFHVTEVGVVTKHFIDCGGVERKEKVANFQLWNADDYEHRLKPTKLLHIINLSEKILNMEDLEIEVEYQSHTIGKYDLAHDGSTFILKSKTTQCLAQDACGVPEKSTYNTMFDLTQSNPNSCTPGGGCC